MTKGDLISRQAVLDELDKWDWQELYLPIHFKQILDDIPSIENKREWIPITSNNYPTDREVLACDENGDMIVGELMCGGERCEVSGTDDYRDHIVAYMEKPEPYKAESEVKPNE